MIKGWCPGALRPMESGDGFLVRLRISGGIVGPGLAGQIADWASRWGDGSIALSNRGNLQIRGVTAAALPALQGALGEAGLLDDSAAGEAVRNVMANPLAGLDPDAVLDVRPIVVALERRLASDASLHRLPGKFGFSIDDGGAWPFDEGAADVGFVAIPGGGFVVGIGGECFGPCEPCEVVDVAVRLASAFLAAASPARRMRDLVAERGALAVAAAAGLVPASAPAVRQRRAFLGVQRLGDAAFVGVALPFGRIEAPDFASLDGPLGLLLTPWRAVLVPMASMDAAFAFAGDLPDTLILDPTDPRRRVAACTGKACRQASTDVQGDAARLARSLAWPPGEQVMLHVSGCAKGCAHPWPAPVTLVGRDGRYDLVRNGRAGAAPVLRGLTL